MKQRSVYIAMRIDLVISVYSNHIIGVAKLIASLIRRSGIKTQPLITACQIKI